MSNIPQNLTLAELERWTYIENLPGKELLDLHWRTVFSQGYEEGKNANSHDYNSGYQIGYVTGYHDGFERTKD